MLGANFWRLLTATGLANLADGIFQVALPLVALGITRDPGDFAAVTLVGRLPWLLVALPAGALADRLDRRRTMMRVDAVRVVVVGGLAVVVATGREEMWVLYAAAFVLGVGETFHDTAAQSILPNVVPVDRLAWANSRLYAVEMSTNQFVGPPLGGLIAAASLAAALSATTAGYALAVVALSLLVGRFTPERPDSTSGLGRDIADGVRYLARHRLLRLLALCVGISNLASTAAFSVFPLYAVAPGPMGLSGAGFGLLLTALAAGALLGSLFVERLERRLGRRRALLMAAATFPLFAAVPALTARPIVVGAASAGWSPIVSGFGRCSGWPPGSAGSACRC